MFLGDWVVVAVVLRVVVALVRVDVVPDRVALVEVVPDRVEVEEVVLVVVPLVVDVPVLAPVPAVEEPLVFPWASWTAELTASPRLLNPASCAALLPAWAVEVAASETALPTPRPAWPWP
ncbi:MAG: hypothetical protein HYV46_18955 [candidate division NC10 bacterium]|nr:hypothetical protein [candidate division NC10 bacterium]